MDKTFWKSLFVVLGGYGVCVYLILNNWNTYKYMPAIVLIGFLSVFFVLGSLLHKRMHQGAVLIGVFLPHIIGDFIYVCALNMKDQVLIKVFREMVPHVYMGADLVPFDVLPSTKLIIMTAVVIPLSFGAVVLGSHWRKSNSTISKWSYNSILVWAVHFVVFVTLTNVATVYPRIFTEQKEMMIFAMGATILLFVAYFFAGRACHTLKNPIAQITSMLSVSATGACLYIGTLLLIGDAGVFERYILPVATSFIGIMCKQIGVMTGATAKVISQYGIIATFLMLVAPLILFYVGKLASISEEKEEIEA